MTGPDPEMTEDDILLAGEYTLGTLGAGDRASAAHRITQDPAFAREVARWQSRLDPLNDAIEPLVPPARVWKALSRRLFAPTPPRFSPWGWFAGASGLAAAVLAAVLWLGEPMPPESGPMWISDMVSQDGRVRLAALYDERTGEMRVSMGGAAPGQGRDFELWLIAGSAAPISLGVMPHAGKAAMPIPPELRSMLADATLAITDEPAGGSPHGIATGPLVAAAPLRRI